MAWGLTVNLMYAVTAGAAVSNPAPAYSSVRIRGSQHLTFESRGTQPQAAIDGY